jgi:hypothetical protein
MNPQAPPAEPRTKRRPTWVFVALLFAQFVALLLVIELLLAWFAPVQFRRPRPPQPDNQWSSHLHRPSTLPGVPYELNPGKSATIRGVLVSVNSLGFRGPEYSVVKPPDTLRIVAMGASVAFGWTTTAEDSYPGQLERLLNEDARGTSRRYEVMNFGVGGYATRDEVAALEQKALPLDPDLIIIDYHPNGPESEPVQPLHQVFHETEWWERWNILRLLSFGRREWQMRTLGGGSNYRYLAAPDGPHWPELLKAFDKARDLAASRDLKVIVILFPTYGGVRSWAEYPIADLHAQTIRAAEERGFLTLDMLPIYTNSGFTVAEIAADDEHPNAVGLGLAAKALEKLILERHEELLKVPPPGPPRSNGDAAPR